VRNSLQGVKEVCAGALATVKGRLAMAQAISDEKILTRVEKLWDRINNLIRQIDEAGLK
jgi:hypothetical protein